MPLRNSSCTPSMMELKMHMQMFLILYRKVHSLASRSRIAPLKGATIPRLELLAALMGARLTKSILESIGWKTVKCFYWKDYTTVLTWITKEENWSIFINNRVQEIWKINPPSSWHRVSGVENPSDLPSRECKASYLGRTKMVDFISRQGTLQ
ncbi:hypothetical protein AVEN_249154-1 [Araneus ventricosus]|uniref:Uncharacterized protein n=1 Tax=Araneus ventricosus TaxID=182803 RepID=A0A4Y2D3Y2_ARAVE|nr:hypothetical protein AVEN_249154-1 [Araneus ventricosus]